jgi:trehalose-phosphatase
MAELFEKLDGASRAPVLLVASDYDGTLAPIVSDPVQAEANRESVAALRMLSQLPQTYVAVVSGRALDDLARRTRDVGEIHLVGSHGSEFEAGIARPLPDQARELLREITQETQRIADRFPGSMIESKPASLAFHYRNVDGEGEAAVVDAVVSGPGRRPGVHLRHGKKVIELSVIEINKGAALQRLRQRIGATAVVFVGDDVTDEDAFLTLTGPDLAIKVGPGSSAAPHRVESTVDVARLLARLAERRADWLAGAEAVPIEQHALISDQRTVALIGPTGRMVWLCLPRIDSAAVFAELLGGPAAGFFEIKSAEHARPLAQAYVGNSFVLWTQWPRFSVTDYLDASAGRGYQRAGRSDLIRAIKGHGRVVITFAPRLDFGRIATRLAAAPNGIIVEGALDPLVLYAPGISWTISDDGQHQTAHSIVELADAPIVLELRYGTANLEPAARPEPFRREQNQGFWQGWAGTISVPAVAPEMVRRSALLIKALTYGPSGAIAAAATTSLPECAGGVRNWDYRFSWPRDAAMAAHALVQLGASGAALKLLDWLMGILDQAEPGSVISPVYTVSGGHLSAEGEIPSLAGYRGSRPVRIGNAAAHQVQLDVFGPIADLIASLAERGAPVTPDHWRLLERMVDVVARHWREPDHGIWEFRLPRRLHVHSRTMCWLTLDRAVTVGRYLGLSRPHWTTLRDEIAADVLERGWSPAREAFVGSYDDDVPDAAALWVGLSGLLPPDDPRFLSTVAYVEKSLRAGPSVYRYRFDDGLPGMEGAFNLCTTWLIEAYCRTGRQQEAADLLEQYAKLAGPTGLLAEEVEPRSGRALGNYPQIYAHLGLINAALAVDSDGELARRSRSG